MNIIFDLDGTLIDSAPTILKGLERVIEISGIIPLLPLTPSLIGPPLKETILQLIGHDSGISMESLVEEFKAYYDSEGYKSSQVYDGIHELLRELVVRNASLYIATNKRFEPTQKIIDYFGWTTHFKHIYSIDKYTEAPFANKAAMIAQLIQEQNIDIQSSLYIGDRIEDQEAASLNTLPTILVNWGYGDFTNVNLSSKVAMSSHDLLSKIMSL